METGEMHSFLTAFRELSELAQRTFGNQTGEPLTDRLSEFLGQPAAELSVVTEEVMGHRYTDWDIALSEVVARDPQAYDLGVGGGDLRHHLSLGDLIAGHHGKTPVGQVDYVSVSVGPDEHRQAIGNGLRLFRYEGAPVVVMQRRGNPQYGREKATLEVLCTDTAARQRLLDEVRALSVERSVLRGQVVSFESSGYGAEAQGVTFLPRPELAADQVILPAGSMARILGHVSEIAAHADLLRRHGQHLKRGLLLYGPPGTGKTHTVRHLISRNASHTVVVLSGESLAFISLAASIARALQPAMVVLEDCDLVAEDREMGPSGRPLLFEVLDAMDGLDADADVTFLLTTNRVEALERALVQRPGRVDLAIEVPLPDEQGRRQLLDLYRGDVDYGEEALAEAAVRTEGMTASFLKELTRSAVLRAAIAHEEPADTHLIGALTELLESHGELTRVLLGGSRNEDMPEDDDEN